MYPVCHRTAGASSSSWCSSSQTSRQMTRILTVLLFLCVHTNCLAVDVARARLSATDANNQTRVVFDLSGPAAHHTFRMRNPERVVIDIMDARASQGLSLQGGDRSLVQRLRYARQKDQRLRLVLDLDRPVSVKSFLLTPDKTSGDRLVIDLTEARDIKPGKPVARAIPRTQSKPAPQPRPVQKKPATPPRDIIVAIDAGHGGEDPGARGRAGTREKDVVLAIARKLRDRVNRERGMRAVMIRNGDYYLTLRKRIALARKNRADLFISIHADAFRDKRVKGASVYVLSQRGASSEAARWLAERENAADLVGGVSLEDRDDVLKSVLLDLSQTATLEASIDVADRVLDGFKRIGQVHKPSVQHAGFVVLKSPDIPSILVETAFISNPTEERKLRDRRHQAAVADTIMSGIRAYFRYHAPPGTLLAQHKHRIERGETLSDIASQYQVSIDRLKSANNLQRDTLYVGETLVIPSAHSDS